MINQIRYFQSVVRNHSFTEAAEECHISQSAISQQIKSLETELGVRLLDRKNRSFTLTSAGEVFYRKSLILMADYERMIQDTVRASRSEIQELRIGYIRSYGSYQLQNAVAAFSREYPEVKVQITGGSHEDLYNMLRLGELDLVLNDQRRAFSDAYINLSLGRRKTYVEIAEGNPMSALPEITAEDLKNTPCILVASRKQEDSEADYYQNIIGIQSGIFFAESLEEARLMAVQNNGFLLIDEGSPEYGTVTRRIPLMRGGKQMETHYCIFCKADHYGRLTQYFAEFLQKAFSN